jgi:tetratricopeptide (TPR) repeat protein
VRRGLTKFVGRERELAEMKRVFESARSGRGQIVAVVADAGTGKSRLFYEFKATLPPECKVLEAYSVSHGKAWAYQPVLGLLYRYFGIGDTDDKPARRAKLETRLSTLDAALTDTFLYIFTLLGIQDTPDPIAQMDPQVKRIRTLEAFKRIVLCESVKQPAVLIFEDLHWIDGETQALLDLLAEGIANARVLLLVNYRPEYRHDWGNKSYYTQLRLDPLRLESTAELLGALLGEATELKALKGLIAERTEGNPFFIEEIVQALFDEGAVVRNGEVKVTRSLSRLLLPPTVQGILAARIDRLKVDQKDLLQTMAVIGRELPLALIRRVALRPEGELKKMLSALQAGEFIYQQPAASGVEYTFKHALTHQVAYDSLLIARRKEIHERAAEAIESMFADHLEDHLIELAHHYSRGDNVNKAVEYLGQAGQQAIQRSAHANAISSLNSAISLLQSLPESRERAQREVRLELTRARAMAIEYGSAPELQQVMVRARELCERFGFAQELSSALLGLCGQHGAQGRFQTVYELAEEVQRRAQAAQDRGPLLSAVAIMGMAEYEMGEFLLARNHLEATISLYDRERDQPVGLRAVYDAGVAARYYACATLWHLGYPEQALRRSNEAVVLAQELSSPLNLAMAKYAVGHQYLLRGEGRAAQSIAELLVALCSEQGFTHWLAGANRLRGWALTEQGNTEEALAQMRKHPASLRATWEKLVTRLDRIELIEAWIRIARLGERPDALSEMLAVAHENENGYLGADINRFKGELLLRQDNSNVAEAESCFQRAIEVARKQSAKSLELRATMSLARLVDNKGKRDEARAMLADIYNWFTEGFDTTDLKDAKALLGELGS